MSCIFFSNLTVSSSPSLISSHQVYKFKATSEAEGKKWVDGLNEWKDYFLMNMH